MPLFVRCAAASTAGGERLQLSEEHHLVYASLCLLQLMRLMPVDADALS